MTCTKRPIVKCPSCGQKRVMHVSGKCKRCFKRSLITRRDGLEEDPPCGCTISEPTPGHTIDYIGVSEWAERRTKKGERQLFCTVCNRWRWQEELGPKSQAITQKEWTRLNKVKVT